VACAPPTHQSFFEYRLKLVTPPQHLAIFDTIAISSRVGFHILEVHARLKTWTLGGRGDHVHANLLDDTLNRPCMNFYIPLILDEVASETPIILHVRIWLDDTLN
jgi:hypothetical protein